MNVVLSENALKQYKNLPKDAQIKVKKKLLALEKDVYLGKKLVGELKDFRSVRVWPYRIIYEINKSKTRIEIHVIAHRQGAYK